MTITIKFAAVLLAGIVTAGACSAQAEAPKPPDSPKVFQLDFVLKELEEGKVINARNYSMMIAGENGNGSIRSGDKLSVRMKDAPQAEYSYLDVGVNIDCRGVREIQGKLSLIVTADISTAAEASNRPVIRTTKWNAGVSIPLKKATVLFISDDATSKHRLQLELTATTIN